MDGEANDLGLANLSQNNALNTKIKNMNMNIDATQLDEDEDDQYQGKIKKKGFDKEKSTNEGVKNEGFLKFLRD